jgi:inorganic pyrophosphatase
VPEPAIPAATAAPIPQVAAFAAPAPPAEPPPEIQSEPSAAEGILKSLAWMDSRIPEEKKPTSRSRTASRPAVLDMFNQGAAADAPPEPVAAPAPQPVAPPVVPSPAPTDPRAALADPVAADPVPPVAPLVPEPPPAPAAPEPVASAIDDVLSAFEPSPAPPSVSDTPTPPPAPTPEPAGLSVFDDPTPAAPVSTPEPSALSVLDDPAPVAPPAPEPPPVAAPEPPPVVAAPAAPAAAPAPAAPAPERKRKPIVIDCPDGEQRRAALADVGPGPDVPYVLHAVIEIPRGGGTGYVYNDMKDVFVVVDHPTAETCAALSHVAYGFVPETVSDDGAHLDAFVLSSGAAGPGELLRIRPLGYLRRADGDHKLICVPEKHKAEALAQIPESILRDCESWKNPTGVTGGTWCDGQKARELIRRCCS